MWSVGGVSTFVYVTNAYDEQIDIKSVSDIIELGLKEIGTPHVNSKRASNPMVRARQPTNFLMISDRISVTIW